MVICDICWTWSLKVRQASGLHSSDADVMDTAQLLHVDMIYSKPLSSAVSLDLYLHDNESS